MVCGSCVLRHALMMVHLLTPLLGANTRLTARCAKQRPCRPASGLALSVCFADSSPKVGALGIAVQFVRLTAATWRTTRTKHSGTPESPLLGEMSPKVTERLYGVEPHREDAPSGTKKLPLWGSWQSRQALTERARTAEETLHASLDQALDMPAQDP